MLTAIEVTGTINANHQLELDEALPGKAAERVRVIVLFEEPVGGISDSEWLNSAAKNEVFGFLSDDAEDMYTLSDGEAIRDEA